MRPEPLVFFEVQTIKAEIDSILGKLKVSGEINNAEGVSIVEHGVVWSNRLKDLELNVNVVLEKAPTTTSTSSSFTVTLSNLNLDSTYYVRAYAKVQNGRTAYGDILTFRYGVNLSIAKHRQLNDTLFFEARITGLKRFAPIFPQIREMGIQLERASGVGFQQITLEKRNPSTQISDGDYDFKIDSIIFNQDYQASFYVISGNKRWVSPPYTFSSVGGWKRLDGFNQALQGAITIEINNKAYVGFGYPNSCDAEDRTKFREYPTPIERFKDIQSDDFVFGRKHASIFSIDNRVFYGLGENNEGNCISSYRCDFFEFIPSTGQSLLVSDCFPGGARTNAVAFSLQGKGFIGLGLGNSSPRYLADFWEFDGRRSWRQLTDPNTTLGNREAAFVFQFADRVFVGGGAAGDRYFNDCWEFIPPGSQSNQISWQPQSSFPDQGRENAFSLTLNGKGYLGLGYHSLIGAFNDFWEFDPQKAIGQQWKRLPDFPGEKRESSVAFTLNGMIYVGGGQGRQPFQNKFTSTYPSDFWVYTPTK
ncbi:hypothetical protein [Haliscomenobacter sp.]|uniref:Kelch repeat-containing protein n=1 Tax=Haliscomenobacter sp. TaxID=2717303 RepID=UPI0029F4907B|nr:hypothetical protein [Haliscomenobacter sp.]